MTSETQSNTNVGSVEAARPDTKLLCAVHDFLDRVEEVPPNELLGLILEALVVRMADQRATDEAIFAAEQEGASIDEAFDMFYLGDCAERLMPSVHGVLDRQDIQEQLAGLTCTVDGMLNHICAQVVGAICPHCCGVEGEHEHGADKLDQSKAELTP